MENLFFVGRLILGGYFLYNAYNHLFKTKDLTAYAVSKSVPRSRAAVIATGILLLFGGYSLLTGVRVEAGITALVIFLVLVSYYMHPYWKEEGPGRMGDQINFWKNMALLGALLMLLAIPTPWPLSLGSY